jgi:homogentisate 1,2-dioxygenase
MKIFSMRDIPPGADGAEHLAPGSPLGDGLGAFVQADAKYYDRGEESEPRRYDDREIMLVVIQGGARLTVDQVDHPVAAGDVAILPRGEEYRISADELDPAVVLEIGARCP